MKFIKRLPLARTDPMSDKFAVLVDDRIITNTKVSISMPVGSDLDRPSIYLNGQVRFNTSINELETYNNVHLGWENIRTVRPAPITQQSLGPGDYTETDFGPLRYSTGEYYTNYTSPQNIFVFIENVFQISTTNYTLIQGAGNVYIRFSEAPPAGKYITVLLGYDGYFPPFPAA